MFRVAASHGTDPNGQIAVDDGTYSMHIVVVVTEPLLTTVLGK